MHFSCAYVRLCVYVCMWVWACVRVRVCVCDCMWWLPPISFPFDPPPFFFLSSPSLSRLPPFFPLPCVYVCVYVCVLFFPSLFSPALKAALHHTPPLHSPSCFDLRDQGISCVRLIGFFRVLRFSHLSPGMFGTGILLFLFQGRT